MKTTELKKGFQDGKYEELLRDIYIDESVLDYQKERYIKAIESFEELFGEKEVEIYSAPGRSEIGGNHTDHQLGRVLAASINLDAIAIVAKKENGVVLKSEGYPMINVSLADLLPKKEEEGTSEGLIRGVAAKLKEEGYEIGGFEAYVTSDVLNGAGMSSSAAFEVLTGNILSGLYNEGKVSPVLIAQAGQYAENVFFGKPCGLMDQMGSSVGGAVAIDFADLLYNGKWFTPLREALQAFAVDTQKHVTGTVKLKLYKGNIITSSVTSPESLYSEKLVTFEESDYNQDDATGFINLWGLPDTVQALRELGKL